MLWRTEGPVELALRLEGGPDLSQARHAIWFHVLIWRFLVVMS